MDGLSGFINQMNDVLWNIFLVVLLCGVGTYYTFLTKGIQFRKFKESCRLIFHAVSSRKEDTAGKEEITPLQSLLTALAAQIGTGNLAGVATAMVSGGPGAVFWMWVSAVLGMATAYGETCLAQKYRFVKNGEILGGPAYYIRAAVKGPAGKAVAASFSIFIIISLTFSNMIQAHSVGSAMELALGIPPGLAGIGLAILSLFVFRGGVKRIVSVSRRIVPFMMGFFTLISLIVIFINYRNIPLAFHDIFVGAFSPQALTGGMMGVSVQKVIRLGIARGLFTHEAGMGSTPHIHALSHSPSPSEQGLFAMMGVFIDTLLLLPLTVLAIMTSGVFGAMNAEGEYLTGIELTQSAYAQSFGQTGYIMITVCALFFAFATIIGWYLFGHANITYLFGKKSVPAYALLSAVLIGIGCIIKWDLLWELADFFNGLTVLPNILALFLLGGVVKKLTPR